MSMIFPGMDPYLEMPELWHGFYNRLIVYMADALQPQIRPRYIATIEERVFVQGPAQRDFIPDVRVKQRSGPMIASTAVLERDAPVELRVPPLEIHESYLQLLDRQSGRRVVNVLEVVSATNKYAGPGRESYLDEQRDVLKSDAHLVEIDLLRRGPHVLAIPETAARSLGAYDYLVCINRSGGTRDRYELYPRQLRQRLPRIGVPLASDDPDVVLDLQAVVEKAYEAGSYRDLLPYDQPCRPPLDAEDQAWANERIAAAPAAQS